MTVLNTGMAAPTVIINGRICAFLPGTIEWCNGKGKFTVRVETVGGAQIQKVVTRDVEGSLPYFKGDMVTRSANIDMADEWLENNSTGGNYIEISEGSNVSSMNNMVLLEEPRKTAGVDGSFSVEFN